MRKLLPPPAAFQDLYSSLNAYLVNFNGTLNAGTFSEFQVFAGDLEDANANAGPQLVTRAIGDLAAIAGLKALGVKAIMVQVVFRSWHRS